MALIDMLGNLFGGGGDVGNDELAQQLGIDPAQLRKTAAMQGLGTLGATLLASAGPSLRPHSFAGDVGQGLMAAQNTYGGATKNATNQAYMLGELKRLKTQDEAQAATMQGEKDWQAQLSDPAFIATLPPELQRNVTVLKGLPRAQGTQIILETTKEAARTAAQDAKDAKGVLQPFGYENSGLRRVMPDGTVQVLMQPKFAPLPGSGPSELDRAAATLRQMGVPEADIRTALLSHFAPGLSKEPPATPEAKADANATAKRIQTLESNLDTLNKREDAANRLLTGLEQGNYQSGGDDSALGKAGRYLAEHAPTAFRPEAVNEFDKASQQFVLDTMSDLHNMRGSNLTTTTVQRSKPGVGLSIDSNKRILSNDILPAIGKTREQLQAELDFYRADPKNTIRLWKPPEDAGAAPARGATTPAAGPGAANTAPAPKQASRPAGLPATAAQDSNGDWYDPATGRKYVQR